MYTYIVQYLGYISLSMCVCVCVCVEVYVQSVCSLFADNGTPRSRGKRTRARARFICPPRRCVLRARCANTFETQYFNILGTCTRIFHETSNVYKTVRFIKNVKRCAHCTALTFNKSTCQLPCTGSINTRTAQRCPSNGASLRCTCM
jgi:hypothetical protein